MSDTQILWLILANVAGIHARLCESKPYELRMVINGCAGFVIAFSLFKVFFP